MQRKVRIQDTEVLLREYDIDKDPEKIVKYLYTLMDSEDGIKQLKEGDKSIYNSIQTKIRLVAEIDGELFASCNLTGCLGPSPNDRFTLNSVVTASKYQGTGLSKIMFQFACDWTRQYNARILLVETWENNIAARKFYEKMGFKQYGQLPNGLINHKGDGYEDEILYYLSLEKEN